MLKVHTKVRKTTQKFLQIDCSGIEGYVQSVLNCLVNWYQGVLSYCDRCGTCKEMPHLFTWAWIGTTAKLIGKKSDQFTLYFHLFRLE